MPVDLLTTEGAVLEETECPVCGEPDATADYRSLLVHRLHEHDITVGGEPDETVDNPTAEGPAAPRTSALGKNNWLEAIRLVLPKGHEVCHDQHVEGPITVYCVKGRAALTTGGATHDLRAGQWVYLLGRDPHALRGIEDSLVLLTVIFPQRA
jgi:quercetin dioxygenase-like cupin family protein